MTHTEVCFAMKTLMAMILGSQPSRYCMPPVNCVLINTFSYLCSKEASHLFSGTWGSTVWLSTLPLFARDHSSCCKIGFFLPHSVFTSTSSTNDSNICDLSYSTILAQTCYVSKSLLLPFLLFLNALHRLGRWLSGQSIPWARTRTWVQILQTHVKDTLRLMCL